MGYTVRIELDERKLRAVLTRRNGPVYEATKDIAERGAVLARLYAPVVTGALRDSIVVRRIGNGPTWAVIAKAEHAKFVHKGTRPHRIQAVRRQALRWGPTDAPIFAAWVNHPGTKANPFLKNALVDAARRRTLKRPRR